MFTVVHIYFHSKEWYIIESIGKQKYPSYLLFSMNPLDAY